ncbi:MAG: hypothetical protein LBB75_05940 [Oscillospiraceae bacterium]|nr:hypothetical protein [Oscillospiraceae bacterium]
MGKAIRFLGILLALAVMAGALAVPAAAVEYYCCEYCEDEAFCEDYCEEYCEDYCGDDCECRQKDEDEASKTFRERVRAFIEYLLDGISFSYEVNRKMDGNFLDVFSIWFDNSRGFDFSGGALVDLFARFRAIFG